MSSTDNKKVRVKKARKARTEEVDCCTRCSDHSNKVTVLPTCDHTCNSVSPSEFSATASAVKNMALCKEVIEMRVKQEQEMNGPLVVVKQSSPVVDQLVSDHNVRVASSNSVQGNSSNHCNSEDEDDLGDIAVSNTIIIIIIVFIDYIILYVLFYIYMIFIIIFIDILFL